MSLQPDALAVVLRLLVAAGFGGVAGAALAGILHRRAERARDASRVAAGGRAAASPDALADAAPDALADAPPDAPAVAPAVAPSAAEAELRARCDALAAKAREARRRVVTLQAERQAADERRAVLEGELRSLRGEREFAATARGESVDDHGQGPGRPSALPVPVAPGAGRAEGAVPVLNRRVEPTDRADEVAPMDEHYPMLSESELPARSEDLRLEDLLDLDDGTG